MSVNEGFMDTLNCFICGMKILLLFIFYLKDKIRPLEKDAPPPPPPPEMPQNYYDF